MSRSSASGEPPLALPKGLLIPVAGVAPEDLVDTYSDARSEGRRHDAVDIMAPRGTPVVAAAEGTVLKLFKSEQGGTTLYQIDPDQRTLYYYAHLDRYASHIMEDVWIRQGETIGYVGDSGNAGAGPKTTRLRRIDTPSWPIGFLNPNRAPGPGTIRSRKASSTGTASGTIRRPTT
jgi:murein DD-endopeptidase MepM/ murein hydrolase activator NlpD